MTKGFILGLVVIPLGCFAVWVLWALQLPTVP